PEPRARARHRPLGCGSPHRPRHRHAPVQSRRPRPCRQRGGTRRALWAAPLSPAAGDAGLDRAARQPAGPGREPALRRPKNTVPPAQTQFSPAERRLIARLRTPNDVQRYLNRLPYNTEPRGETLRSFRQVLRHGKTHCSEAALFAACVLEQHGYPPLLMTFESVDYLDHVVFVYRERGRWGSVARSRDPGLHGRKPVFRSPRALALRYFDPYIDPTACITGFAVVDLRAFDAYDWRFARKHMWSIERFLTGIRHRRIRSSRERVARMRARYDAYLAKYGRKPL